MDVLSIAAGVALGVLISRGVAQAIQHGGFHRDDTDGPKTRSGLVILTDHRTGVQYVSSQFGMAVRVDANGRPVTVRAK